MIHSAIGSLLGPFVIAGLFVVLAYRQSRKLGRAARDRLAAERAKTVAAVARAAAAKSAAGQRPAPARPPAPPGAARPRVIPPGEFLTAPGLIPRTTAAASLRARRTRTKRWTAAAVVAAEVLGPPVGMRPGGTLGPPGAF